MDFRRNHTGVEMNYLTSVALSRVLASPITAEFHIRPTGATKTKFNVSRSSDVDFLIYGNFRFPTFGVRVCFVIKFDGFVREFASKIDAAFVGFH